MEEKLLLNYKGVDIYVGLDNEWNEIYIIYGKNRRYTYATYYCDLKYVKRRIREEIKLGNL